MSYTVEFKKPYLNYKTGDKIELDVYKAAQLKEAGYVTGKDIPSAREAQRMMIFGEKIQRQQIKQFTKIKNKQNGSNN